MCGIVGGICQNNITPLLIDGLKHLEYRGYDSAGLGVLTPDNVLQLCKVSQNSNNPFRRSCAYKVHDTPFRENIS
jgi:glucosamine 6-phosphate synthetase-like amidotransferase/phosphosugar isomerase protein